MQTLILTSRNNSCSRLWKMSNFFLRNLRISRSRYSFWPRISRCSSWASSCFRLSFWLLSTDVEITRLTVTSVMTLGSYYTWLDRKCRLTLQKNLIECSSKWNPAILLLHRCETS